MQAVCGDFPWGPWQGSTFTRCFNDVALGGMLSLFMLIGGAKRLLYLRSKVRRYHHVAWLSLKRNTVVFSLSALIVVLQFVNVIGEYLSSDANGLFHLIYAVLACASWAFCCVVIWSDVIRGIPHNWELTTWWLLQCVFWSFRIQQLADHTPGVEVINYYTWIPSFVMCLVVTVLGVWFNKASSTQYKKLPNNKSKVGMKVFNGKEGANDVGAEEGEDDNDDEDEEDESMTWTSQTPTPEDSASFLSRGTFWWINSFMQRGFTTPITDDIVWAIANQDKVKGVTAKFEDCWRHQLKQPQPSLTKAIIYTFWRSCIQSGCLKFCSDMATLLNPVFLSRLINFVENSNEPMYYGILYAIGIFFCQLVRSVFANQHFYFVQRGGVKCRSALSSEVYRKALRLSSAARQKSTTGEIVNHQAIDANKFVSVAPHFHMFWSGPLQIGVSLYMLFNLLGLAGIGGLLGMVALIPINTLISRTNAKYQKVLLVHRDARMRMLNEVLNGMRVIKFFSWEISFIDKIRAIRELELASLLWTVTMRALTSIVMYTSPIFVAAATFTTYTLLGNELTPQVAFTSLAVFTVLRQPLNQFPQSISGFVEANVSIKRLQKFLLSEELDPNAVQSMSSGSDDAITISNGNFKWVDSGDVQDRKNESSTPMTLSNIELSIKRGSLIAVVGSVGSGKTSLVSALIGEIPKYSGSVNINGTVAFVSQQPWIKNSTLRGNILFGCPYDEFQYKEVLNSCELEQDLSFLPNADLTEIGERGINLSGGQKARVSLARAMYQNADIYILDSPLAAVDAYVGRNIFTKCITGALKDKTRFLVTHQADLLPSVDHIIFMKGGCVAAQGSYNQLLQTNKEFSDLITEFVNKEHAKASPETSEEPRATKKKTEKPEGEKPQEQKKLIQNEHQNLGSVGFGIYKHYFKATGGMHVILFTLFCFAADTACRSFADWWLSRWSDNEEDAETGAPTSHKSMYFYLGIYLLGMGTSIVFVIVKTILVTQGGLASARKLHNEMLERVFHAPITFFDTTPTGRLLNRFSKDQNGIDEGLMQAVLLFGNQAFLAISVIGVVSLASPIFRAALVPLLYLFYYAQQYYLRSSRELQRLDSISKSPIFAQLSETLNGLSTIRALNSTHRFIDENDKKIDNNTRIQTIIQAANRWLAMRMELLCTATVAMASFFAVLARDNTDPGLAGLSISYALQFTFILNMLVRQGCDVETQLVSVERVVEYTRIDNEGPYYAPAAVPPAWPQHGQISMHNLQMRYRAGLDLVLKGITCDIKPKEKIGICGRTGAGKSSFVAALFRLVEFAAGKIEIDGVDISSVGLHDLRSRLSIIPQDPTLFMGTIRSNLDPFEEADDHKIWDVLERVNLKSFVSSLPDGLQARVTENGENFSVGQRQLMCLGRSLIKEAKILVMDEATAAVDIETDQFIQKTIRTGFKDCTVLTIAHRLNTIIDYDRIMVMDNGHICEFDTPQKLLSDTQGVFYSLIHSAHSSLPPSSNNSDSDNNNNL